MNRAHSVACIDQVQVGAAKVGQGGQGGEGGDATV